MGKSVNEVEAINNEYNIARKVMKNSNCENLVKIIDCFYWYENKYLK